MDRDLEPDNLLGTRDDRLKILDLGLVAAFEFFEVGGLFGCVPLPLDPSTSYCGDSLVLLAHALAHTLCAFRIALGARHVLIPAPHT